MIKIKRALISVFDKTQILEFAKELHELDIEIISTGGTKKMLDGAGIPLRSVSEYTQAEEMLNGRVKTLHPKIHAGILALRDNQMHIKELKDAGIELIDMIVVNLYPFEEVIQEKGVTLNKAVENIDIGGSTLLRAAAKNVNFVVAVCNPNQYSRIIKELKENDNQLSNITLSELATEVFKYTSSYDRTIYEYLKYNANPITDGAGDANGQFSFSQELEFKVQKIQDLRYGENPHQKAAFYRDDKITEPSVCLAKQLHGKELSFNNIIDMDAVLEIVEDFKEPAACVIKHTNPCGMATDSNLALAYEKALETDPLSAFGGIVGLNNVVDEDTAQLINKSDFIECVIAPGYTEKALAILKTRKNIRVLDVSHMNRHGLDVDIKKITGGLLVQEKDVVRIDPKGLKVVTKKKPTQKQIDSLLFAWCVCKHVKSNAIVLARGTQTVGIGAGQMSRVDAVIIAARKAKNRTKDSVLASDAFFPKKDAIEMASRAGVKAIIQPGGSIRDQDIIETANKAGISMVFTGIRHFKH